MSTILGGLGVGGAGGAASGGGGGTPGGSDTQIQFNDSGAFGGDSTFTYHADENRQVVVKGNIGGGDIDPAVVAAFQNANWGNAGLVIYGATSLVNLDDNVINLMAIGTTSTWAAPQKCAAGRNVFELVGIGWDGSSFLQPVKIVAQTLTDLDLGTAVDFRVELATGSTHRITGVIAANDTPGLAFAALPASPVLGDRACITDSNTATWGATIAGGGANTVLAWFNGTNWTVVGT